MDSNSCCRIGETGYKTLAAAIKAVPINKETTINLLTNTSGSFTINANMNIILNMKNFKITGTSKQVIINKRILKEELYKI